MSYKKAHSHGNEKPTRNQGVLARTNGMATHERFRPFDQGRFKSTGESNAAIEDLKRKLDRLGARYHWSESAREYRLDYINVSPDCIEETDVRND